MRLKRKFNKSLKLKVQNKKCHTYLNGIPLSWLIPFMNHQEWNLEKILNLKISINSLFKKLKMAEYLDKKQSQ